MAPTRRYLRITSHSVLECRIYLENPALLDTWLLRRNDPALPRIIAGVKHLVLPKLREENERAATKGRGKKKQAIKDVVVKDDFEVSIFLKDQSSRHTILTKKKEFSNKPKLKSNSKKLTAWLSDGDVDRPIDVDDLPVAINVEDEEVPVLSAIPEAQPRNDDEDDVVTLPSDNEDAEDNALFVARNPDHETLETTADDKKKLGLKTMYDGFAIYGRILCLIVKKRGASAPSKNASGQAMMEGWVSTQVQQELGLDPEDT